MARDVKLPKAAGDGERSRGGLLERTLNVLELLSVRGQGMQLYEIAETLHIPRSAAHRVLTSSSSEVMSGRTGTRASISSPPR